MSEPKIVQWMDSPRVHRIQYEDGTGVLCNLTYTTQPGMQIVGNGSLQAPLKVEIEDGYALVRKDDIYALLREIFEGATSTVQRSLGGVGRGS